MRRVGLGEVLGVTPESDRECVSDAEYNFMCYAQHVARARSFRSLPIDTHKFSRRETPLITHSKHGGSFEPMPRVTGAGACIACAGTTGWDDYSGLPRAVEAGKEKTQ